MNSMERYVRLDGLKERKRTLREHDSPKIIVRHDEIEVHGKGIVQRLIEKYKKL